MILRLNQRLPGDHPALIRAGWKVGRGGERLGTAGGGPVEGGCGERWGRAWRALGVWGRQQRLEWRQGVPPWLAPFPSLELSSFLRTGDLFSHHCSLPVLARFQPRFQQLCLEIQAEPLRQPPCCLPSSVSCPAWVVLPGCLCSRGAGPPGTAWAPSSGCRLGGGLATEHAESWGVLEAIQGPARKGRGVESAAATSSH